MELTIGEVMCKGSLNIPSYQRDYAWRALDEAGKKNNISELWEDLTDAKQSEKESFLGTLVAVKKTGDEFEIVDGQQRLTTIVMILKALIENSGSDDVKKTRTIKYLLNDQGGYKFRPKNVEFFEKLLNGASNENLLEQLDTKTQGEKNLLEVFKAILKKVKNLSLDDRESYLQTLLNTKILWFVRNGEGEAIRIFQGVNDRGVKLKLLDKLKAFLMYYSNMHCDSERINGGNLDEYISDKFGEIFEISMKIQDHRYGFAPSEDDIFRWHAGSRKFDELERFINTYYGVGSDDIYERFKSYVKELGKKSKDDLRSFIESYTNDLRDFYQAFLDIWDEIKINPNFFRFFMIGKFGTRFYNSIGRLKVLNLLDDDMLELYAKADMLSGGRKHQFNIALSINQNTTKNEARGILEKYIKGPNINIDGSIEYFVRDAFVTGNTFHYLFFMQNCMDMDMSQLSKLAPQKQTAQTKEHIISQSLHDNEEIEALKQYGFDDLASFKHDMHSYGNLLSLERDYNSEANENPSEYKAITYDKSEIPFNQNFRFVIEKGFNKDKINERNNDFKQWLRETYFKEFIS